jgi:hypothetical protein
MQSCRYAMSHDEIRAVLFIASGIAIAGHAIEYRKELRRRGNELAYSWREFLLEREFEMDKDVLLVAILAVVLMVMGLHAPLPVTIFSGLLIAVLIWRPGSKQT